MALSELVKLGDPLLLMKSEPVVQNEIKKLMPEIEKMWRLILEFRGAYGRGRAIAAPQIGLLKRIICMNTGIPQGILKMKCRSYYSMNMTTLKEFLPYQEQKILIVSDG